MKLDLGEEIRLWGSLGGSLRGSLGGSLWGSLWSSLHNSLRIENGRIFIERMFPFWQPIYTRINYEEAFLG